MTCSLPRSSHRLHTLISWRRSGGTRRKWESSGPAGIGVEPEPAGCASATERQKGAVPGNWTSPLFASSRMDPRTIEKIKQRVAQCRRLAAFTTDQKVASTLLQMAEEAEADLKQMEAEAIPTTIAIVPNGER